MRLPLALEQYDFIDFGCSQGGSLAFAKRYLGGTRGFGIDIDPAKVALTRSTGYDAAQGDLTDLRLPDACVDFVIISHMLEHLPDEATCRAVLASAVRVARKFVYVQGPWFDADRYLALLGLKMTWSDWSGHTLHVTSHMLGRMLAELGREEASLFGRKIVANSDDPVILPAQAPRNCQRYALEHGWKPAVAFNRQVFRDLVSVIPAPGFDVQSLRGSLAPVAQTLFSLGKAAARLKAMYSVSSAQEMLKHIREESRPEDIQSNTVLKKSLSRRKVAVGDSRLVQASSVVPDNRLRTEGSSRGARYVDVLPPEQTQAALRELHLWLLKGKTWRYLRYLHARTALKIVVDEVQSVLVIGAGYGIAEIALALEFPHIQFHLTDYQGATHPRRFATHYIERFGIANVSFGELDILQAPGERRYDLVYSVEVLEHIEDDALAAANMHTLSNRYIFCLVPYAQEALNSDPQRLAHVREKVGHCLVGYNPMRLVKMFPDLVTIRGCYWSNAGHALRKKIEAMEPEQIEVEVETLLCLASQDDRDCIPVILSEAFGIWCIATSAARNGKSAVG